MMEEAQRDAALAVVRVLSGMNVSAAIGALDSPARAPNDRRRALVQELVYGTLRYWGTLDALVRLLARKRLPDASLHALVAVALYQLEHTRAPAFAVVDHAVNVAGTLARPAAKSLVNALLRRFLREQTALLARVRSDPVARWSYQAWWIERVQRQ